MLQKIGPDKGLSSWQRDRYENVVPLDTPVAHPPQSMGKARHMTDKLQISGRIITAARGLTGVSRDDFAAAAGLSVGVLAAIERSGGAFVQSEPDLKGLARGLEHFGVVIVPEGDGMGAGVRLKFTRQDVRQIARLEGEGGPIGSDDAP